MLAVMPMLADNDKMITREELPGKAQMFLTKHFDGVEVLYAKAERDMGVITSYDVVLDGNVKVEFNRSGEWTSVDMGKNGSVPADIMPANINSYVTARHPNSNVVDIDKDFFEYKVELSNGIEIVFEKDGDFKRYDD
jgi:hypothetical protein